MSSITLGDSGKFITSLLVSYDDILILVPPFLALCAIYRRLEPSWSTSRQHAWVLTTLTSALMTLVSIPLLADYLSSGGDVKSVRALPILTYTTCRFFQAYLLASVSCSLQIPPVKESLQLYLVIWPWDFCIIDRKWIFSLAGSTICFTFASYNIRSDVGGLISFVYAPWWRYVSTLFPTPFSSLT